MAAYQALRFTTCPTHKLLAIKRLLAKCHAALASTSLHLMLLRQEVHVANDPWVIIMALQGDRRASARYKYTTQPAEECGSYSKKQAHRGHSRGCRWLTRPPMKA